MKKLLLSIIILLGAVFSFAQNVNIPDPIFKAFLVGDPTINTSGDGEIQVGEAAAYADTINAGALGINNLTGIEAFTALLVLDCSNNNLTSLDLTDNVSLIRCNCSYNNLTSLDVSYMPNLGFLNCCFNNLTCVDVSTDTALVLLNCANNNLSSLNLKNGHNTSLSSMTSLNNAPLSCIQVDNVAYAMTAGWPHDTWSNYNLFCGAPATASFTANDPVCFGTPVSFTNTSTNSNKWCWDFGDGDTSTQQNPTHTYAGTGSYMVYLIASNCNSKDTTSVPVNQGTNIYGTASYSLGNVGAGFAVLYPHQPIFISFDTLQVVPLDAFGNFIFGHVPQGNYLVQIFPDTAIYPTLVPTYYTSDWLWDSASVHSHGCFTDSYPNVTMAELTPSTPGIGYIQGFVISDSTYGRAQGDPVHGVVVKRGITGSSQVLETTVTDTNGEYMFSNVGFGNYTIYVDIPGLHRDSVYDIIVDASTNQFLNLYYVADSSRVYILPGIGIEDISPDDNSELKVFPNPVIENATIKYAMNVNAKVELAVYNLLGVKVQSLVNGYLQNGEYECNFNPKSKNLEPGIYFISLTVAGRTKTTSIIVME